MEGPPVRTGNRLRPSAIMLTAIAAALVATAALSAGGPGGASAASASGGATSPKIDVVAAENQYGDVAAQVGGAYVHVTSLLSDPSTDPHTFEASAAVAREVGGAGLVVQNGLGYDSFMNSIISAAPNPARKVINAQRLLDLPDSTPNPHLWYDPAAMPKVARAVATDLSALQPAHAAYFQANARKFTRALAAWREALGKVPKDATVASSEPVADYLLNAAGVRNLTPWSFQSAVMNGTDPSPQDVAAEKALISGREVKALVYNEQVTDPLTESLITLAHSHHVPVVGVYETMPEPGYDYQSWMQSATSALHRAVERHR